MRFENILIRPALSKDFEAIRQIMNILRYCPETEPEKGFVVDVETISNIHHSQPLGSFLVCKHEDKGVIGFAQTGHAIKRKLLPKLTLNDDINKDMLLSGQILHVNQIGVRPEFQGKGIGSYIYQYLIAHYPDSYMTAFTTQAPVRNEAAEHFYEKMGFHKIGSYKAEEFGEFSNYKSILWGRNNKEATGDT